MRISDWSSDVCSSDLAVPAVEYREVFGEIEPHPLPVSAETAQVHVGEIHGDSSSTWITIASSAFERNASTTLEGNSVVRCRISFRMSTASRRGALCSGRHGSRAALKSAGFGMPALAVFLFPLNSSPMAPRKTTFAYSSAYC